jgi:predicted secreted protein
MHWVVLGGAFAILWYLALQIVLPMGNRTTQEAGDTLAAGTDPGAPIRPRLALKFALATGVAVVLWLILYGLVLLKVIDL